MKCALIGTGLICEQHMIALRQIRAAQVVGLCDLSPAMANFAAQRFGPVQPFTDHRRMLEEKRPQVVHVLTPPASHMRLVRDCLEAGSHVIVEKPAATSHEAFLRLWEIARRVERHLVEDQNYRFNQPIVAIDQLIDAGKLGTVEEVDIRIQLDVRRKGSRVADANWPHASHRLPAGVIHEFITHMAYLALHFLPCGQRPEPDRVTAAWSNHGGDQLFKFDDLDALVIRGSQHARLRFSARTQPGMFAVTVRGSRGYVQTDLFQPYLRAVWPRGGQQLAPIVNHFANGMSLVRASATEFLNKVRQFTPYHGLHRLIARTYEALDTGRPMPVTFDQIDSASRLVDQLLEPANRL